VVSDGLFGLPAAFAPGAGVEPGAAVESLDEADEAGAEDPESEEDAAEDEMDGEAVAEADAETDAETDEDGADDVGAALGGIKPETLEIGIDVIPLTITDGAGEPLAEAEAVAADDVAPAESFEARPEAEAETEADADAVSEVADEDAAESVGLALADEDTAEPVALAESVAEEVVTATRVHCFVSSTKGCPFCPVTGVKVIVQVSSIGPCGVCTVSCVCTVIGCWVAS
jgi:hypothetical protein